MLEIGANLSEQLHFMNEVFVTVAEKSSDPASALSQLVSDGLKAAMSRFKKG
jgi:hypothetical protein